MQSIRRTVVAFNTATENENRIHDDAVASRFGFAGGLVPGVDVFGYMAHAPVKMWGEAWLADGRISARFLNPVYDGREAVLVAEVAAGGGLALELSSGGDLCARGEAAPGAGEEPILPPPAGAPVDPGARPPASPESLRVGAVLGWTPERYTAELGRAHLADIREDPHLFDDGRIANPAYLLRRANAILADNVKLGPWIHVGSDIRLHALVIDGDILDVRARPVLNEERKGHLIVELDFAILVADRPVLSGRHTAIYVPRQVRERVGDHPAA